MTEPQSNAAEAAVQGLSANDNAHPYVRALMRMRAEAETETAERDTLGARREELQDLEKDARLLARTIYVLERGCEAEFFAEVHEDRRLSGWAQVVGPTKVIELWGAMKRAVEFEDRRRAARMERAHQKGTLRFLHTDQLEALGEASDFVENVLFDDQLSTIVGRWGSGKSFFALDLAMHVALGRRWRGRGVRQGGVIFIALEGVGGIRRRFEAWCRHHNVDPATIPIAFADGAFDLRKDEGTKRALVAFAKEAERKWSVSVRWIVIDTLARAMSGGDENSAKDMSGFRDGMDYVRRETGANVCAIHHVGKDESRGGRGSNLLISDVDTEITIRRNDDGHVARLTKQKEGEDGLGWGFGLEVVDLGLTSHWGKPITSCVVIPADAPTEAPKLPRSEQAAYDALCEMMRDELRGVAEEEWRARCREKGRVSDADKEADRRRATNRAIRALRDKEVIDVHDGRVFKHDPRREEFEDLSEGRDNDDFDLI